MITKQAIERLKNFKAREKRRALPDDFNVYVEHQYNIDALDMAIEALSKQSASSEQADDVPDIHVGKTDFKPGDKFILELGQERRIFGEFEIKGTNLLVKTSSLEKLTRYEPEKNATADKVLIDLAEAIEIVNYECGEWKGLARTIVNGLKKLSPKQSEKMPYKKPEIIRCKDCKYSVDEYSEGDCYCRRPKKGIDYIGNWNFYCADAERRNDG